LLSTNILYRVENSKSLLNTSLALNLD